MLGYPQKLISHSSGAWKVQDRGIWWGPPSSFIAIILLCPHMAEGARENSEVFLRRALNPILRAFPWWLIICTKPHLFISSPREVSTSTHDFGEDTNIPSASQQYVKENLFRTNYGRKTWYSGGSGTTSLGLDVCFQNTVFIVLLMFVGWSLSLFIC